MVGELGLVGHYVVVGADKVLLQLIVECLSGYLHADAKYDLDVYYLFFQCSIQYPQMPLPWLFDWVFGLVLGGHDLIQVDLVIQKVIKL